MSNETFEEWFHIRVLEISKVFQREPSEFQGKPPIMVEEAWSHQQKKIDELEKKLQAEREKVALLRETVEFYGEGEIGNDLEIRPEKKELWSIPEKWSQRSMSDHYAGKRARQALEKLKEIEGEEWV